MRRHSRYIREWTPEQDPTLRPTIRPAANPELSRRQAQLLNLVNRWVDENKPEAEFNEKFKSSLHQLVLNGEVDVRLGDNGQVIMSLTEKGKIAADSVDPIDETDEGRDYDELLDTNPYAPRQRDPRFAAAPRQRDPRFAAAPRQLSNPSDEPTYVAVRRAGCWLNGASRFDMACKHTHSTPDGAQRCAERTQRMRGHFGPEEQWTFVSISAWWNNQSARECGEEWTDKDIRPNPAAAGPHPALERAAAECGGRLQELGGGYAAQDNRFAIAFDVICMQLKIANREREILALVADTPAGRVEIRRAEATYRATRGDL
jgi:hypothetical protein